MRKPVFPRWPTSAKRSESELIAAREAFRVLRSNLLVTIAELENPIIVFTSAAEGEGKTSTCVAMAQSLAAAGSRLVLVDLDFRDPDAHRLLGGHNRIGVSDVLLGRKPLEECVQHVTFRADSAQTAELSLLAAGPPVANPTELLSLPSMSGLLDRVAADADIVLLDTPPVLSVADTLVIGRLAAGVVLVVEAHRTPGPTVKRAKEALSRSEMRLLGVVLNKFEARSAGDSYDSTRSVYGSENGVGRDRPRGAHSIRPRD